MSPVLNVLINGNMREAQEGRVMWPDVAVDTFSRFISFVYTGHYDEPQPEVPEDTQTGDVSEISADQLLNDDSEAWKNLPHAPSVLPYSFTMYLEIKGRCDSGRLSGSGPSRKRPRTAPTTARFAELQAFESRFCRFASNFKKCPRRNVAASEFYKPIFLCHARLYAFAEKYDIVPLGKLSLRRLHQTLVFFIVYDENVPDLICLVEEIYEHTFEGSPARNMITTYLSFFVACLINRADFRDLLGRADGFAPDLIEQMTMET